MVYLLTYLPPQNALRNVCLYIVKSRSENYFVVKNDIGYLRKKEIIEDLDRLRKNVLGLLMGRRLTTRK